MSWQQTNDQYSLRFDAPFNTGVLKIKGHKGFSELILDNKKTLQGENPEQLIAEVTPFNIPVSGLTHWIRGIPHQRTSKSIKIKANGETKSIQQDGWLIQYEEWAEELIGLKHYKLPEKIILTQGDLTIKISPSQWIHQPLEKNSVFSDLDFK